MERTHTAIAADGSRMPLAHCKCKQCEEEWFVRGIQEFAPKFCPYCGMELFSYTDAAGVLRNLAGFSEDDVERG